MQSLYYRLLYPFYHSPSTRAEREYIERACDRLYTLHPDVGQSALSQNKLERPFQYDLQIIVPAYNVELYSRMYRFHIGAAHILPYSRYSSE